MREIKFRAWHPKNGMLDYEHCALAPLGSIGGETSNKDVIWMQYTGLKDKNGREIYEGDLVRRQDNPNDLGKIYWSDYDSRFSVNPSWCGEPEGGWGPSNSIEVIGNVYENPELLKLLKEE